MPSKNPNSPTRARATKSTSTARPAAPRRRPATRTTAPADAAPETVAEDQASADSAIAAPAGSSIDYAEYVRTRAYYLHLERKGRPGNPVEDWLAAERELGHGAERNA
jgi:hypothetical protein